MNIRFFRISSKIFGLTKKNEKNGKFQRQTMFLMYFHFSSDKFPSSPFFLSQDQDIPRNDVAKSLYIACEFFAIPIRGKQYMILFHFIRFLFGRRLKRPHLRNKDTHHLYGMTNKSKNE